MSKYHILKNSDFHNHNDDSITTNASDTIATVSPLTDHEENFGLFNRKGGHYHQHHHHSTDQDQLRHENSGHKLKHHIQKIFYDDDDDVVADNLYSHDHSDLLLVSDNHVEDLIQYNNNNIIDNKKQNIYTNNNSGSNDNNTPSTTGKIIFTNTNNLMTPLDSAATAADEFTMEIPLLQQNFNSNNNYNEERRNNFAHKQQYDFECVCLFNQKGFASNLKTNSTKSAKSKILWAIVLCCIFMVVEFLGGYLAGSLAIMTDAAHLASDCISFVIGLVAIWLGSKPPDAKMSFGYKRFEVMGAIVSILGIWILTATLVLVAIQRIYSNDYDLDANTMMTISGIGILINIIMIFILHTSVLDLPAGSIGSSHGHSHSHNHNGHHHGHSHSHSTNLHRRHSNDSGQLYTEFATRSLLPTDSDADATDAIDTGGATSMELSSAPMVLNGNLSKHQQDGNDNNLNLRAAMIHVIGDLIQSFGVFLASVLIKIFPKAVFLDPLCTLLFSIIVIMTTINLFKESMHLIMDSIPQGLSIDDLEMDLLNIEGVKSVHHLNVWNHTSNYSILMVHLVIDILTDSNTVLMKATQLAGSAKYNIKHSTIQIERVTS
ncbi:zinc transporter 8 isoform X1 [Lucilia cuprina]|uniref:zinc transporter 8 isoform X1 n=2 Tax=Lucilia cuprina TaxID=7375 RepID=UPI001F056013|nr:zinc transporter 8 isoform X1 [Lucilia cuprina]XP_046810990.1 zinc transporter 8 isoform X1 [Lucilia cuprina]